MRRRVEPIAVALLISVLQCACGTSPTDGTEKVAVDHREVATTTKGLELNDGKRWKVAPHMVAPIQRMRERIAEARTIVVEQRDHVALADSLFVDIDQLVAACDMKGKAHDVSHGWLMPHMRLAHDLERASDPLVADSVLHALVRSFATYDLYFE